MGAHTVRTRMSRSCEFPGNAAGRVLEWIEQHILADHLGPGDSLPGEIKIAAAAKAGRSSVREALTAMKVLGIIRHPVLLKLRHYFGNHSRSLAVLADTLEFRAAVEWGFGSLILACVGLPTIRTLRNIVRETVTKATSWKQLHMAEIRFHSVLMTGCGNHLARLFAHLDESAFHSLPVNGGKH